jgi:hypothetical protein
VTDTDVAQLSLFYRPRPKVHREPQDQELAAALEDIDRSRAGHEGYERALRTVRHLLLVGSAVVDHERVADLARCDTSVAYSANVSAVIQGWATPACSTFAKIRKAL